MQNTFSDTLRLRHEGNNGISDNEELAVEGGTELGLRKENQIFKVFAKWRSILGLKLRSVR